MHLLWTSGDALKEFCFTKKKESVIVHFSILLCAFSAFAVVEFTTMATHLGFLHWDFILVAPVRQHPNAGVNT